MPYKDISTQKRAQREHYERNKDKWVARRTHFREEARKILRERKDVPCTDCGIRYPYYVMDFDHQRDKKFALSYLANISSIDILLEEILKCEVVCSNCHRERTYGPVV